MDRDSQGRQIIYIDASALKEVACRRKFYWNTIAGLKAKVNYATDYKMAYGTAFHKFIELRYQGVNYKEAIVTASEVYMPYAEELPFDDYRTIEHLIYSMKAYNNTYPIESEGLLPNMVNGKPEVELKFAFPYWQNSRFVIMLCGTIDLRGTYHGIACLSDHKTTAAKKEYYFNEYEMAIQPMFYCWIDKQLNYRPDYLPFVINGIFIKMRTQKAEKEGRFDGVSFQRSTVISYGKELMNQFEYWLFGVLEEIKHGLNQPDPQAHFESRFELSACRTPFGLCTYFGLCKAPMEVRQLFKETKYEPTTYSPLTWRD